MALPGSDQRRHPDKRPWWTVYSENQLLEAELRLGRSWRRANPRTHDDGRQTDPDFFAMNRVRSRRLRQRFIARESAK